MFPLDGALLLPGRQLPLHIFEPRYLNMVDDAMAGERMIGMIQTRAGGDAPGPALARVGCAGRITSYSETGDGRYLITLTGVCRFDAGEELALPTPYRQVRADYDVFADDLAEDDDAVEFDRAPFLAPLRRYLDQQGLGIEWEAVDAGAGPGPDQQPGHGPAVRSGREAGAARGARPRGAPRRPCSALLEIDAAEGVDDDDDPRSVQ